MASALNNLKRVDMPLNKETKPKKPNQSFKKWSSLGERSGEYIDEKDFISQVNAKLFERIEHYGSR